VRALILAAGLALPAVSAFAEMKDEEHIVGGRFVVISKTLDTLETMTVGRSHQDKMQVLSGADIEIVALAGDTDSVALLGQPVVVAEVIGTQSCEEGDARDYWVITLGEVPAPEGPVTTCQALTPSVTSGALVLTGEGEAWAWSPGKGWAARAE
jgi:hypothetical protein